MTDKDERQKERDDAVWKPKKRRGNPMYKPGEGE